MTHTDDLRAWAKGAYTTEAGTELLIRAFGGRFAAPGQPWVREDELSGKPWIDFEAIPDETGALSGGERRFLMVAASLAEDVPVALGEVLPGLDREAVELVLAAVAHCAGSHEHSGITHHDDGTATVHRLPSLYEWPKEAKRLRAVPDSDE